MSYVRPVSRAVESMRARISESGWRPVYIGSAETGIKISSSCAFVILPTAPSFLGLTAFNKTFPISNQKS